MSSVRWLAVVGALLLIALAVAAPIASAAESPTPEWVQQSPATSPSASFASSMAYDPATGEMVLFGGGSNGSESNETWTYDGSEWIEQATTESPSVRHAASMAYDPATGKMVLFGGASGGGYTNDTWTYDGTEWTEQKPSHSPSVRDGASMAYDPATGQMVLFGGFNGSYDNETWTYDGSEWTKQTTTESPSARNAASMAYDPATGQMVLFGGAGSGGLNNETWTYDGSEWTKQTTTESPSARFGASMAYDPATGQMTLFGGVGSGGYSGETWTYDGSEWAEQPGATNPPGRNWASMAFDPATGQMVLFGGQTSLGVYSTDTWTYGAPSALPSEWIEKTLTTSPPALNGAGMAFDPATGETVLFGGRNANTYFGKTWIYDGEHWMEKNVAQSPSPRWSSAMAFDPAIGKIVLFGGADANGYLNETWVYEGETWKKLSPPTSPTPRYSTSMAYDPAIGRMVLFGGYREFEPLEETWTFDGTTWTLANPTTHPSGRPGAGMDFDPQAGQMTLFGGQNPNTGVYPNETWTYKDANWAVQSTATSPPGRRELSMVFDPAIGKMVMFGGAGNPAMLGDTWTYDEGNWTKESPLQSPSPRFRAPSTFDEATGQMVLFGGSESTFYSDTWVYQQVKATPTISTTPTTGVTVGATISDEATVSGRVEPSEGDEVEFNLYGPDDSGCSHGAIETIMSPALQTEPAVSTAGYTPTEAGTYYWTAKYMGDVNNEAVESPCEEVGETSTVNKATPSISAAPSRATLGGAIHDEATVKSRIEPQAGATIEFKLYAPGDATCEHAIETFSVAYPASGEPVVSSGNYTTTEAGTYHWTAIYSGDVNNEGAESVCEAAHAVSNEVLVGSVASTQIQPIDIATNTDDSPITVESEPEQLAVSPDQETAYVANHGSNTVSVIDTTTNAVTATITGFSAPEGVAFDPAGGVAYVANSAGNTVSVIDTTTNAITATIPVGSNPWQIAFTPDGSTAYVTNSDDDSVSVIDVPSSTVVATIPGFDNPKGVIVTPDGRTVYVANDFGSSGEQGTVTPIATATNAAGSPIAVPANPIALAATPDGSEVLVANHFGGSPNGSTITPIDTADNTPGTPYLPCFNYGNFGTPLGIEVTPDGQTIYTDNLNNYMACYDSAASPTPTAANTTYANSPGGVAIAAPMRIGNATTLPAPIVEASYSRALWSVNGTYPMTYSVASGSLPPGVSLSSSGVLSGMPTAAGSYSFTVQSSDSSSAQQSAAKTFDLEVQKAAPTISTTATGPVTVGTKVKDTATLSGGASPGGTIVFKLYGPNDSSCHNAAVSDSGPITVAGNGNYESGEYPTTQAGAYYWTVEYSGDANNSAATSACEASGETSTVDKAALTLSTTASPGVTLGGAKVKDTATLTGGYSASGTVTFKLYGPDDTNCTGGIAFEDTETVASDSAVSAEFEPTEAGTYRWKAEYSGDSNNSVATDACNGSNESVTVSKAAPTISTTPGGPVTVGQTLEDEAKVEGRVDPQAGAEIEFKLYPPSDANCTGSPVEAFEVDYEPSDTTVSSGPYTTTEAGTYHWSAIYSGDVNNQGASSLCTEASAADKATPSISTTATGPVTVGAAIEDEATVEGRIEPQAGSEVEFSLYGPEDPTCLGSPLETFSVPYGASGEPAVASGPYTTTQAGAYHWTAEYTGDSNNEAVESPCEEAGETSVVDKATPAIATTASGEVRLGASVTDKAAISGAYSATGSVVFKLYGPDDQSCTGAPAFTSSPVAVSGNGDYSSPAFTPAKTGAYRWVAAYSGDGNNQAVSGACGEANESVVVAAPVCSPVQSQVGNYVPKEVVTGAVPGVRARLKVPVPSEQEVQAMLHFRLNGKSHSVDLGSHTLNNPGARNFHVPLPGSLAKHLPLRTKVVLSLRITSTPRASLGCVEPTTSHRKLHTRVVRVLPS